MHVDFLLIGQGICGTFLSWYLQKAGYSFIVIDEHRPTAASNVAAGIINPVTGRRLVETWLIDEVMPFACEAYQQLGAELGITAIAQKNNIDFFPTPQMKLAFEKRYTESTRYLSLPMDEWNWRGFFSYDFGYGIIDPCYLVNLRELLPVYRKRLLDQQLLWQEKFDQEHLQVQPGKVQYKDITASAIIFCDGIASFQNPYFSLLPFAPNKGEVLWIEAPEVPDTHIFKRGINLVPWKENIFWVGSSYEWDFDNDQPTTAFREQMVTALTHWLKVPVRLVDHKASIRPATLERRPFIGFHPHQPAVGIFNGMGTKGCSLSPWFASQLVNHIRDKSPIHPEADIKRFERVLRRKS